MKFIIVKEFASGIQVTMRKKGPTFELWNGKANIYIKPSEDFTTKAQALLLSLELVEAVAYAEKIETMSQEELEAIGLEE